MFLNFVGSLGLFLLGMWMMTEGLKLAGGRALESLLARWTSSRKQALASGILITGIVQSSGAVIVATMGFVSAELMTFQQALWVVFGSNVGTTFTAWIVTYFGFSVDIDAFTYPLVGIGAAMRLFLPYERGKALGMALAGFGLLFMGIEALNDNFSGYASHVNIEAILAGSNFQFILALCIGFVLTVLTQSSSASIAIILTAVASGVAGLYIAIAAVIGANIGSTSTALLASIGASPQVKRVAWAHVLFNLLAGFVTILLLPLFWPFVAWLSEAQELQHNPVMLVAIFHTCFNLLGVFLMWPIEPAFSRFLLSLYQEQSENPRLDTSLANIPDLAIRVMTIELNTLIDATANLLLPIDNQPGSSLEDIATIRRRLDNLNDFISLASKSELTSRHGDQLTLGLSVSHHLNYACRTFSEALEDFYTIDKTPEQVPPPLRLWFVMVNEYTHMIGHTDIILLQERLVELQKSYQSTKLLLLSAARERLSIHILDTALQTASLSRRYVELVLQANDAFRKLSHPIATEKSGEETGMAETIRAKEAGNNP